MAYLVQQFASNANSASPCKSRVSENDSDIYREVVDFADMEQLLCADAKSSGFRLIAQDAACDISLYSRPVDNCPIHLMRAEAFLPCSPAELLAYMHVSIRRKWDDYITELRHVRTLPRPPDVKASEVTDVDNETLLQLQPGQRRVALHYMAIRSPIPLVQNRDFELVVAEEVCHDGTAWVKAFSTPFGYVEPLDPRQSKYVRALLLYSGILGRPASGADGRKGCRVSYVALVHPMGLTPPVIVNLVLGAQLTALRKLQRFILNHPLDMLSLAGKAYSGISDDKTVVKVGNEAHGSAQPAAEMPDGASVTDSGGADDKRNRHNNGNKNRGRSMNDNGGRGTTAVTTKRRITSAARNRLSLLGVQVMDGLLSHL